MISNINNEIISFIEDIKNSRASKNNNLDGIWKSVLRERHIKGEPTYENTLKLLFLSINSDKYISTEFINACGSKNLDTKRIGYLGAMFLNTENETILMVNTLKKDLKQKDTRNMALQFIANFGRKIVSINEISKSLCIKKSHVNYNLNDIIAFYSINQDSKLKLVERDSENLYLKLQLLMDNNLTNFIILENDQLYLQSVFVKNKDINLKIKILQFLRLFVRKSNLSMDNDFLKRVEEKLIKVSLSKKSTLELALSLEIVELFLTYDFDSIDAHGFIFKLIESSKEYMIMTGLNLINKYQIHNDIGIYRCIEIGIEKPEVLNIMLNLVNEENYNFLYEHKERSKMLMINRNVALQRVQEIWTIISQKIFEHKNDEINYKILLEYPDIAQKKILSNYINQNTLIKLYNNITQNPDLKDDLKYFKLIYQIIFELKKSDCELLFEQHLEIILRNQSFIKNNKEKEILINLLNTMYTTGCYRYNYLIIMQFFSMIKNNTFIKNIFDQYSLLFRLGLKEKMLNYKNIYFLYEIRQLDDRPVTVITLFYQNNVDIEIIENSQYFIKDITRDKQFNLICLELYDNEVKTIELEILHKKEQGFQEIIIKK